MTSEALKPCPFCGGNAEWLDLDVPPSNDDFGGSIIQCMRCGAGSHIEFGRKENLASRWNTRAREAAIKAENERLREVLGALGAIGNGYCFCFGYTHGRDPGRQFHLPECHDARALLNEDQAVSGGE